MTVEKIRPFLRSLTVSFQSGFPSFFRDFLVGFFLEIIANDVRAYLQETNLDEFL